LDLTRPRVVERLRTAQLTLVHGATDEYITPKVVSGITARLDAHGIPYRAVPFAGGHGLDDAVLRSLAGT
jgi:predicted esterase